MKVICFEFSSIYVREMQSCLIKVHAISEPLTRNIKGFTKDLDPTLLTKYRAIKYYVTYTFNN